MLVKHSKWTLILIKVIKIIFFCYLFFFSLELHMCAAQWEWWSCDLFKLEFYHLTCFNCYGLYNEESFPSISQMLADVILCISGSIKLLSQIMDLDFKVQTFSCRDVIWMIAPLSVASPLRTCLVCCRGRWNKFYQQMLHVAFVAGKWSQHLCLTYYMQIWCKVKVAYSYYKWLAFRGKFIIKWWGGNIVMTVFVAKVLLQNWLQQVLQLFL